MALNPDGAFSIGIKIGRRSLDLLRVDFTAQVRERLTLGLDARACRPGAGKKLGLLAQPQFCKTPPRPGCRVRDSSPGFDRP